MSVMQWRKYIQCKQCQMMHLSLRQCKIKKYERCYMCYNVTMLKCYNVTVLQCYNVTVFTMSQCYNMLQKNGGSAFGGSSISLDPPSWWHGVSSTLFCTVVTMTITLTNNNNNNNNPPAWRFGVSLPLFYRYAHTTKLFVICQYCKRVITIPIGEADKLITCLRQFRVQQSSGLHNAQIALPTLYSWIANFRD